MEYLDINIMHTPQTYLNNKLIRFPYKKAEALFYYVAVEKIVTRDKAAAMFWCGCDNEVAQKNLRHALYMLKKTFGSTVVVSLPNHLIGLSDTCAIRCDLDNFYKKRELGLYKDEIFQGFRIPNAVLFEKWLGQKRESAKSFFFSNYPEHVQAMPDTAAARLPEPALEAKGAVYRTQLKELYDLYREYLAGSGRAVLLSGENGAGKGSLIKEFIGAAIPQNALVLRVACYMKNKGIMLQPWNDLMLQVHKYISEKGIDIPHPLAGAVNNLVPAFDVSGMVFASAADKNHDFRSGKNSILQILLLVARHTQLIIQFENIQAMDTLSLDILTDLIHTARQEIFVLCTSLDVLDRDTESFISATHHNHQLERIHLLPLSFAEAKELLRAESSSFPLTDNQIQEIYKSSQGNLFFIRELLENMKNGRPLEDFSAHIQDMLNDQLNGLSESARQLLDVISVFAIYVVFDEICYMQNESAVEVSRLLDQLKRRGLILEKIIEDRVCLTFAHLRMRDFIYGKIPPAQKRALHEMAGTVCENVAAFNIETEYHLMIRHYTLAGNYAKALQYRIQKLSAEMLPDYQSFVDFAAEAGSRSSPSMYLQSLIDELAQRREQQPKEVEYDRLQAMLLLAKCRCCLLSGELDAGIAAFNALLAGRYVWDNMQFFFKAYIQLMDYVIRSGGSNVIDVMEQAYGQIKEFAGASGEAAFLQLQALPAILGGDIEKTQYFLAKTVRCIHKK